VILAAGLGTRLWPLTKRCPKALVPVVGRAAIDHVVHRFVDAGIYRIAVNTHHKGEGIAAHCASSCPADVEMLFSHEPQILGTGGGIGNLRPFLAGDSPFLVHNGDVLSDVDLREVVAYHRFSGAAVTMVLRPDVSRRTVWIHETGEVMAVGVQPPTGDGNLSVMDFAGISVIDPSFLSYLPYGEPASLVDALQAFICKHPGGVRGYTLEQCAWRDLGTLSSYLNAHEDILMKRLPLIPPECIPESTIYRGEETVVSPTAVMNGFVSLGKRCRVEDGVVLKNCVVWDGTVIRSGVRAEDSVLGPGWMVSLKTGES
jgi:mannose-1-phosphate guanylyltransferase